MTSAAEDSLPPRAPAPTPRPAIEIQGLVKRFGGQPVLDGIDLAIAPGQVFGYIGPNGAGKSTTVKILAGMLGYDAGRVTVAGYDVSSKPLEVKRRIGYLPENAQLYESLTVQEHLHLVGRLHGMELEAIEHRSRAMLGPLGLRQRMASRLGALSKGMRQKVMITAALLHDPDILYFDEPLSGLDVHSTVLVKELLRALAGRGKTILYCSHMMDVVERVCDRIAILQNGRILAQGTFDDLSAEAGRRRTLEQTFLDLTHGGDESALAREVLAALGDGADTAGNHGR